MLARTLVATRPGSHALVVGADLYSRILDFDDRRTAVLFGDGAGAAVVGPVPADSRGIVEFDLASRGDAHDLIRVEAGGSRQPASTKTLADGGHFFRMKGRDVTEIVLHEVPPFVDKLLARAGTTAADVDHVVPHQANGVLLEQLVERCGLTGAHTHRTVEKYGNVGSASVPVTLDEANRAGRLADGDLVLLLGFGGGHVHGCVPAALGRTGQRTTNQLREVICMNRIRRVGVVGCGVMGAGLAEVCARAGLDVLVAVSRPEPGRAPAGERLLRSLDTAVRKGKLTEAERDAALRAGVVHRRPRRLRRPPVRPRGRARAGVGEAGRVRDAGQGGRPTRTRSSAPTPRRSRSSSSAGSPTGRAR